MCPHTTIYVFTYYYMCPHTGLYTGEAIQEVMESYEVELDGKVQLR